MGDSKKNRWSVTYTKHINQKRKVYQDGFLDFHISTNKVMLYDDCEKLLECRILKKDEVVSSGETLRFNAYLVDVGDLEGDHNKPISDINLQGIDKKVIKKSGSIFSDGKSNVDRNKARPINLSPSQKIIREFKKNELHKYGALQSSPDTTKNSTTEWQVLYTTQTTQKAKKYHDGFLRLTLCGSSGRQVMLFDGSRNLLDSRFLKKDEVIRSGESIAFDAHLVDIGECEGNHKTPMDLNAQENNCNNVGTDISHGQQNCLGSNRYVGKESVKSEVSTYGAPQSSPDKSSATEWQVMYTTQVTQKAKKYHDGLLRLAICGSLGRQVMLYDASRKLLSSRFLKKDEVIRPGESIVFDGYLVDIGEPEGNHQHVMNLNVQGNNCNVVEKSVIMHGLQNCLKDEKSVVKEWHALYTGQITQKAKKYHNGILRLASCGSYRMQVTLLTEDKTTLSSKFLSLSEDVKTGNTYVLPKYLVEVGEQCLNSEERPQSNICPGKDGDPNICISSVENIKLSNRIPRNKPSCDGKPQNNAFSRIYADSHFSTDEIKLSKNVSTNKSLRDAHQILSILQKPVARENTARSIDNSMMKPASSTKELQVSDATNDLPEDGQLLRAVLPHHRSSENMVISKASENMEIGNSSDIMSSKAISSCSSGQVIRDTDIGNSQQPHLDNMETDSKCCDEAVASNVSCSSVYASHCSSDDERKNSEVLKSAREMDECPTFDLGF